MHFIFKETIRCKPFFYFQQVHFLSLSLPPQNQLIVNNYPKKGKWLWSIMYTETRSFSINGIKLQFIFKEIPYLFDLAPSLELAPTSNKRPPKKAKSLISAQGDNSNKYGNTVLTNCLGYCELREPSELAKMDVSVDQVNTKKIYQYVIKISNINTLKNSF